MLPVKAMGKHRVTQCLCLPDSFHCGQERGLISVLHYKDKDIIWLNTSQQQWPNKSSISSCLVGDRYFNVRIGASKFFHHLHMHSLGSQVRPSLVDARVSGKAGCVPTALPQSLYTDPTDPSLITPMLQGWINPMVMRWSYRLCHVSCVITICMHL